MPATGLGSQPHFARCLWRKVLSHAGRKNLKEVLANGLLDCQNFTRILNQKLMKTENTSVTPEAAVSKQAWSAPTLDCLSVSFGTALTTVTGMDGGMANVSNT